jgi:hypothetical protein
MRHARALLLIVLTTVLLVVPAGHALAGPPATRATATQSFTCVGTVVAASQGGLTVTVQHASLALKGVLGGRLALTVTSKSTFMVILQGRSRSVSAPCLPTGDMIAVQGTVDATSEPGTTLFDVTTATAWRPQVLNRFVCAGTVTSVCPQPGALSLVVTVGRGSSGMGCSTGSSVTIDVPAGAGIYVLQHRLATTTTFSDLTAGDIVQVGGTADRTDSRVPLFTASRVLATHVATVDQLTWFALRGVIDGPGPSAGSLLVTLTCGTRAVRADIGAELTLTATPSSVVRTLAGGLVATLPVGDVTAGESIAVTGAIDRSVPASPVFEIGSAFVWQAATP